MGKRQLLFVTYGDENIEEGVTYAIALAKAMYEDITLLIVKKKTGLMDRFGNIMTAAAFAEAGEHETARRIAAEDEANVQRRPVQLPAEIARKCSAEGIALAIHETELEALPGIRSYLKGHSGVDKIVLSPAVTGSDAMSAKDLTRLVRTASRPIVTMTRQACAAAC
jgi:hypothetical protein